MPSREKAVLQMPRAICRRASAILARSTRLAEDTNALETQVYHAISSVPAVMIARLQEITGLSQIQHSGYLMANCSSI